MLIKRTLDYQCRTLRFLKMKQINKYQNSPNESFAKVSYHLFRVVYRPSFGKNRIVRNHYLLYERNFGSAHISVQSLHSQNQSFKDPKLSIEKNNAPKMSHTEGIHRRICIFTVQTIKDAGILWLTREKHITFVRVKSLSLGCSFDVISDRFSYSSIRAIQIMSNDELRKNSFRHLTYIITQKVIELKWHILYKNILHFHNFCPQT